MGKRTCPHQGIHSTTRLSERLGSAMHETVARVSRYRRGAHPLTTCTLPSPGLTVAWQLSAVISGWVDGSWVFSTTHISKVSWERSLSGGGLSRGHGISQNRRTL